MNEPLILIVALFALEIRENDLNPDEGNGSASSPYGPSITTLQRRVFKHPGHELILS